jgi:hypothetical protein
MSYRDLYPTDTRDPYQAAVDRVFPVPDTPHASVAQRAIDNRAAMWHGIEAARAILAQPGASPAATTASVGGDAAPLPAWAASAFREIAASATRNNNAYIKLLAEDALARQGAPKEASQ